MDKWSFKTKFIDLLKADVDGLTQEGKIKYMKKWLRENEQKQQNQAEVLDKQSGLKVGVLVNTTFKKLVASQSLSNEMIVLLQEERYSKNTFDINYPFLKKVDRRASLSEQRKVNGYDRYWKDDIIINGERYFVCSQWYERNKPKFIKWHNHIGV
ncbi:hypothetical protein [Neobacillus niacini]|uniref:hypothetical protein n=1 Tax=Neobacillus niacini TaxID=86668 RepID=UPI0021CB32EA|nr:hypothetical protein [Neobacillus niacini]MCM3768759.1 hypothetical protein [Neobacillus niacini]